MDSNNIRRYIGWLKWGIHFALKWSMPLCLVVLIFSLYLVLSDGETLGIAYMALFYFYILIWVEIPAAVGLALIAIFHKYHKEPIFPNIKYGLRQLGFLTLVVTTCIILTMGLLPVLEDW